MPRHRAPSPSRLSITGVLVGTTLGASVLLPGTALGQPAASGHVGSVDGATSGSDAAGSRHSRHDSDDPRDSSRDSRDDSRDSDDFRDGSRDADDRSGRHRSAVHRHARQHGHVRHQDVRTRPLTSGERQYRNGCRQGYILNGCAQFDVPHLLRRGINPLG